MALHSIISLLAVLLCGAGVGLLVVTSTTPNWVKAVYKDQASGEECQIGNLGANTAEFTPECAGQWSPDLGNLESFTSDTTEFWPLFPFQAPSNGNPLVSNGGLVEFESCQASADAIEANVAAVPSAKRALEAPAGSVRTLAQGVPTLLSQAVETLKNDTAPLFAGETPAFNGISAALPLLGPFPSVLSLLGTYFDDTASGPLKTGLADLPPQQSQSLIVGLETYGAVCGCALQTDTSESCPFAGFEMLGVAFYESLYCATEKSSEILLAGGNATEIGQIVGACATPLVLSGAYDEATCFKAGRDFTLFSNDLIAGAAVSAAEDALAPNSTSDIGSVLTNVVGPLLNQAVSFQYLVPTFSAIVSDAPGLTDEGFFGLIYQEPAYSQLVQSQGAQALFLQVASATNPIFASPVGASLLAQMFELGKYCAVQSPDFNPALFDDTPSEVFRGYAAAQGLNQVVAAAVNGPGVPFESCTEIVSTVGAALLFAGEDLGLQVGAFQNASMAGNNELVAAALAEIRTMTTAFSEPSLANVFLNRYELAYMTSDSFLALVEGLQPGTTKADLERALGLAANCGCPVQDTPAFAAEVCADPAILALRVLENGSPAPITDVSTCVDNYLPGALVRLLLSSGFSDSSLAVTAEESVAKCTDDEEDLRRIKLGRQMLVVALPISIVGVVTGVLATGLSFRSGGSKVAGLCFLAAVCALVQFGLTIFGLLTVQGAPVYESVGVPCEQGVCYESDYVTTIAQAAVFVPLLSGVFFLVGACLALRAAPEDTVLAQHKVELDEASPSLEVYSFNPKYDI